MARNCIVQPNNEFTFVWFFERAKAVRFHPTKSNPGIALMFVYNRPAAAVLLPLAMLVLAVIWSR